MRQIVSQDRLRSARQRREALIQVPAQGWAVLRLARSARLRVPRSVHAHAPVRLAMLEPPLAVLRSRRPAGHPPPVRPRATPRKEMIGPPRSAEADAMKGCFQTSSSNLLARDAIARLRLDIQRRAGAGSAPGGLRAIRAPCPGRRVWRSAASGSASPRPAPTGPHRSACGHS